MFMANFEKFETHVDAEILDAALGARLAAE
jgi:hypothetical protein